MKKLNNKGFAITGTLYSILIFFILLLLSFVSALATRKRFYDNITDNTKEYLEMATVDEVITLKSSSLSYTTTENAKYRFELQDFSYEIYLPKDVTIKINGNPVSTVQIITTKNNVKTTTNVITYSTTYQVVTNNMFKFVKSSENSTVTDRTQMIIRKILK